jgi:DNA end-binding protein Ku
MASTVWKGHLTFGLVSLPVRLFSAARGESISFNQLHKSDNSRVKQVLFCQLEDKPVPREELVKGYEYEKGKYVLLDQKEIDELKLESKQTIELVRFVDPSAIDARYFERPYYLLPDGESAEEGYAIMLKALKQADKVGVGNFILRGQGNIVALKPCGKGLLLEILRHADEIKSADTFFKEVPDVKVDKEALELAVELIERKSGAFEPEKFKDEYTEAVWELINAKIEHRAPTVETGEAPTAKVINIMDALKKSVKAQGKQAAPSKGQQGKRGAASRSAAKKNSRATPKRKSA